MKPIGDTYKVPKSALHDLCIDPSFGQSANLSTGLLEKNKRHRTASNVPAEDQPLLRSEGTSSHTHQHIGDGSTPSFSTHPQQPPSSTGSLLLCHRQHLLMKNKLLREIFK